MLTIAILSWAPVWYNFNEWNLTTEQDNVEKYLTTKTTKLYDTTASMI